MLTVKNGMALLQDDELRLCDILLANGRIAEIGIHLAAESPVDASGCFVLPGLIDLHTHGIGFESLATCSMKDYARTEASFGASTFFPTLFASPEELVRQMERHRNETDEFRELPQIGGFRLESPYLARQGAGRPGELAPIDPKMTGLLMKAGGRHIRIWDISPELPGAAELIQKLSVDGIVCSIAHTQSSIEQAHLAVAAGATLVTHMFDTFILPEMTDPGVYPAALVDYLLVEDRVACEIIADGTHVHPILVEKALRCKTSRRIAFITDSSYGAGLPPGKYVLPGSRERIAIKGHNDGVRLVDHGMTLAGSSLTPIAAFRNAMQLFGQDIAGASQLCSKSPARLMGLNKGEIAVGKDADLIILDSQYELIYTIVAGKIVYQKQG